MEEKGLSVRDVQNLLKAIGVDVNRSTINRHRAGSLKFTTIENYLNALDCRLSELLVAEDPPDDRQLKLPMPPQ
jgi:DNA-binding Xre family transcriptional regulator